MLSLTLQCSRQSKKILFIDTLQGRCGGSDVPSNPDVVTPSSAWWSLVDLLQSQEKTLDWSSIDWWFPQSHESCYPTTSKKISKHYNPLSTHNLHINNGPKITLVFVKPVTSTWIEELLWKRRQAFVIGWRSEGETTIETCYFSHLNFLLTRSRQ